MITRIGRPSPITGAEIKALIELAAAIWTFFGQKSAGVDPRVEKAISAVEAEVGLTRDVMWAWNWYDRRYWNPFICKIPEYIDIEYTCLAPLFWDEDWSDERYEEALAEAEQTGKVEGYSSWSSYKSYAQKHFYWWDSAHWTKMIKGSLGRVKYHLDKEINRLAAEIGYEIKPWYIKYLPYGVMAGLGIALILVLTGGRREPRIIYLKKP